MKGLLILAVALMLSSNCAHPAQQQTRNIFANQNATTLGNQEQTKTMGSDNTRKEREKHNDVPAEFKNIDFKNLFYPISWTKHPIHLKDGKREFFKDKIFGNAWFQLDDVSYVDLEGDGRREAIVHLSQVICGGSCDGSSALFYFFSVERGKLTLLSHIETGSIAYTCGLRSFQLTSRILTLEAFRKCSFDGVTLRSAYDADSVGGKFIANEFTRLAFHFNGKRFVLRHRVLLPNPDNDVRNYRSRVDIGND